MAGDTVENIQFPVCLKCLQICDVGSIMDWRKLHGRSLIFYGSTLEGGACNITGTCAEKLPMRNL